MQGLGQQFDLNNLKQKQKNSRSIKCPCWLRIPSPHGHHHHHWPSKGNIINVYTAIKQHSTTKEKNGESIIDCDGEGLLLLGALVIIDQLLFFFFSFLSFFWLSTGSPSLSLSVYNSSLTDVLPL